MRILIFMLCITYFSNAVLAKTEPLPPAANHLSNLALQGKWFELQDVRKALLAKNPQDITGLMLKVAEEFQEVRYDELNMTLASLKSVLDKSNMEEFTKKMVKLIVIDNLSDFASKDVTDLLAKHREGMRKHLDKVHAGAYPLMSEAYATLFGFLEEEGILTFEGLDITIREFPFVDYVERLWIQRLDGFGQTLNIAKKILKNDSENVAGLLLRAAYELKALQYDQMKKTILQIEKIGANITTKRFVKRFPALKEALHKDLDYIGNQPDRIVKERQKSLKQDGGGGGLLTYKQFLLDCEEDGLVSMPDLEESKSSKYYWATIPVVLLLIGFAVYLRRRGQKVEDASA